MTSEHFEALAKHRSALAESDSELALAIYTELTDAGTAPSVARATAEWLAHPNVTQTMVGERFDVTTAAVGDAAGRVTVTDHKPRPALLEAVAAQLGWEEGEEYTLEPQRKLDEHTGNRVTDTGLKRLYWRLYARDDDRL